MPTGGGGTRKGTGASGPRDLHVQAPRASRVVSPTFSPVGPAQSPRHTHGVYVHTCKDTLSGRDTLSSTHAHTPACARSATRTLIPACACSATCTLIPACAHSCLPVHARPHACSHLPALVPRASPSSSLNVGEPGPPGRRVSPGCPDQGPSLSFPAWRAGGNGRRASWDSLRREPEPRAPLHSWCPRVPSSLLAAPALPASLEVSGLPAQWMSDGDGQCPALGSSLLSAERLQLA